MFGPGELAFECFPGNRCEMGNRKPAIGPRPAAQKKTEGEALRFSSTAKLLYCS
jgi:hypothetical protein